MTEEKAAPRAANEDEEKAAAQAEADDHDLQTDEGAPVDADTSESDESVSSESSSAEAESDEASAEAQESGEASQDAEDDGEPDESATAKPPGPKMVVIDDDDPDLDNLEILTGPARSELEEAEDDGSDIEIEMEDARDREADRRRAQAQKKAQDAITESIIRAKNELQDVLKQTQKEAQTLQEQFLRSKADFENFKKRANREKDMAVKFANEKLLKELLPVLDNMERAVDAAKKSAGESGEKGAETVATGVSMVLKQFHDALGRFDVEQFTALGKVFDPNFHEAVQQKEDASVPSGTVIEEYQKGYTLGGRLVRASMVIVSTGGPPPPKKGEGEESPGDGASEGGSVEAKGGDAPDAEPSTEAQKDATEEAERPEGPGDPDASDKESQEEDSSNHTVDEDSGDPSPAGEDAETDTIAEDGAEDKETSGES
jgi:molecular chaperone GrpE